MAGTPSLTDQRVLGHPCAQPTAAHTLVRRVRQQVREQQPEINMNMKHDMTRSAAATEARELPCVIHVSPTVGLGYSVVGPNFSRPQNTEWLRGRRRQKRAWTKQPGSLRRSKRERDQLTIVHCPGDSKNHGQWCLPPAPPFSGCLTHGGRASRRHPSGAGYNKLSLPRRMVDCEC